MPRSAKHERSTFRYEVWLPFSFTGLSSVDTALYDLNYPVQE